MAPMGADEDDAVACGLVIVVAVLLLVSLTGLAGEEGMAGAAGEGSGAAAGWEPAPTGPGGEVGPTALRFWASACLPAQHANGLQFKTTVDSASNCSAHRVK